MRAALESLSVRDRTVHIQFQAVPEVALTLRGPGHVAACVLERTPFGPRATPSRS
jgi:hypothetical protein